MALLSQRSTNVIHFVSYDPNDKSLLSQINRGPTWKSMERQFSSPSLVLTTPLHLCSQLLHLSSTALFLRVLGHWDYLYWFRWVRRPPLEANGYRRPDSNFNFWSYCFLCTLILRLVQPPRLHTCKKQGTKSIKNCSWTLSMILLQHTSRATWRVYQSFYHP